MAAAGTGSVADTTAAAGAAGADLPAVLIAGDGVGAVVEVVVEAVAGAAATGAAGAVACATAGALCLLGRALAVLLLRAAGVAEGEDAFGSANAVPDGFVA